MIEIFSFIIVLLLLCVCFLGIVLRTKCVENCVLVSSYDSLRAFKHDYANALQAIGGYIQLGDMNGLKKFYGDFSHELHKSGIIDVLDTEVINNPAVYKTLISKYWNATEKKIDMTINVCADLSNLSISDFDINRIFGILLDNSIEAAKESVDKKINISITRLNNNIIVRIENTYVDENIDINKIFEKSFTTKKNNTGLGLWEIKRILNKYKNIKLNTKIDDDLFIQELILK